MAGYANRILHLQFPELSEDYDTDPIWVAIRNPKTQPPAALRPSEVELGPDGRPVNSDDAMTSMYQIISGLIVGARVYDATFEELDEDGVPLDQPLLTKPWTPEKVQQLPMAIITKIGKEMTAGVNPQ